MKTKFRTVALVLLGMCAGILSLNAQVFRSSDYIQQHLDSESIRSLAEEWMNDTLPNNDLNAGLLFLELNDTANADTCFSRYARYNTDHVPYYEGWKAYIEGSEESFGAAEQNFIAFEKKLRNYHVTFHKGEIDFWWATILDSEDDVDAQTVLDRYEHAIGSYVIIKDNVRYASQYVVKALRRAAALADQLQDTVKAKSYYKQLVDDIDILTGGDLDNLPVANVDRNGYAYAAYRYAFLCMEEEQWDEAEVLSYLDKSINANEEAKAYLEKGRICFSKEGDLAAEKLAFECFQNAAEQDSTIAFAYYCIGYCYECGIGCEANKSDAIQYYIKAYKVALETGDDKTQDLVKKAAKDLGFERQLQDDGGSRAIRDAIRNQLQPNKNEVKPEPQLRYGTSPEQGKKVGK